MGPAWGLGNRELMVDGATTGRGWPAETVQLVLAGRFDGSQPGAAGPGWAAMRCYGTAVGAQKAPGDAGPRSWF
jgi:hypothetical protein